MTTRRIETHELIATVRRVAKEQKLYRTETILHLNLAAAELERLAYPRARTGLQGVGADDAYSRRKGSTLRAHSDPDGGGVK